MKFSLIICGYNESKSIDMCVQSCLEQNFSKDDYEIIYVDNNSSDDSVEIAKKYPIKVISELRQGLSEARNCGIKNSTGDILVFLDVDLRLDKDYLRYHQETFTNSSVGAGGGKVLPLIKTWVSNYLGVSFFENYPRSNKSKFVRTYPGCNLTIRRNVIAQVGMFAEKFVNGAVEVPRFEDKEICQRIKKSGYLILYNSKPTIYHLNRYLLKDLLNVWTKGAKSRDYFIRKGKKDPFTLIFKFNLPLLYLFSLVITFFFSNFIFFGLLSIGAISMLALVIKSAVDTGMYFEAFLIKPWMDALSLIIINIAVIGYRYGISK